MTNPVQDDTATHDNTEVKQATPEQIRDAMVANAFALYDAGVSYLRSKGIQEKAAARDLAVQAYYRVVLLSNMLGPDEREFLNELPVFLEPGTLKRPARV